MVSGGGGALRKRQARAGGGAGPSGARPPPSHAPREAVDQDGVPYVTNRESPSSPPPWHPNMETSLKILTSVRLSAGIWSAIADCDETFNYWEPAHFLLYGKGFQTWEYSPQFALRSYLYVLAHAVPGWAFDRITSPHRLYVFYFVRCMLAVASACCEVYFVTGIKKELGVNVSRLALAASLLSPGMFFASAAFLPSSTSMCMTALAYGAWFRRDLALATFFVAISALFSWPFAALTGVPIALDILRRGLSLPFAKWCLVSAAALLLPMAAVDSQLYGRTVLAPANIVLYNVFTEHGPDLYGTESPKFYFMNGFLNFNLLFPVALAAWPLQWAASRLAPSRRYPGDIPRPLILLALYLWLLVFTAQAHKEERFLFPVYPLVCLAAAVGVDAVQRLFFATFIKVQNRHYLDHSNWISAATLILFSVLSLSRIVSVHLNYGAPLSAWIHLSHIPLEPGYQAPQGKVNVCIGKEWHRFPTSFFLPGDEWELRYLRSEFRGQLPQPFLTGEDATKEIRDTFNDLNKEEDNRYEVSLEECHYLVDLDTRRETELEPRYSVDTERWEKLVEFPFLDAASSGCSGLLRSFYVPILSAQKCAYSDYQVLKNKKPAVAGGSSQKSRDAATAAKKKKKIRHL